MKHYDYKSNGYYFVTICCSNKNTVAAEQSSAIRIGQIGKASLCGYSMHDGKAGALQLPKYSAIIEKYLANLEKYEGVKVDYYKLMTDHLHFILILEGAKLPLCRYIQDFKSKTTLEIKKDGFAGKRFWQPNYYEHIIRNEISLSKIRQYIEDNPLVENLNWAELDR